MSDDVTLGAEFPAATRAQWLKLVEGVLKGAPYDKLVARTYDGLPIKPEYHVVPNAGHFAFLAPCSAGLKSIAPDICRDPAGFDRAAFHREFNAAVVAFFKAKLPARP